MYVILSQKSLKHNKCQIGPNITVDLLSSNNNYTDTTAESGVIIYGFAQLLHPLAAFVLTIVLTLLISLITGGKDIYSLDWNLVLCTCNNWTERMKLPIGGEKKIKREKKGGYLASESFREVHFI